MKFQTDHERYFNLLAATAIGDSLGLPFENMPGKRVQKLTKSGLRQRFLFGRFGVISDDTEHALITARSLLDAGGDPDRFERVLSKRLKRWLLAFPPGVGKATLLSIISMWFVHPSKAGRKSAGNGPLMRAPIIGLYYANDASLRDEMIVRSTRMTHADPRALFMAAGIAEIVSESANGPITWSDMSRIFRSQTDKHAKPGDAKHVQELKKLLDILDDLGIRAQGMAIPLQKIGCGNGIDGYCYRSALAAAYIVSANSNTWDAIRFAVSMGGDTDSTAAIAAALGAANSDLPADKLSGIRDWPVTPAYLEAHAGELVKRKPTSIPEPAYFTQLMRNAFVVALDMGHILRRIFPPY